MSNWIKKIAAQNAQIEAYLDKHKGRSIRVDIYHDDWCRHKRGKTCNCNPDITFTDCGPSTPESCKEAADMMDAIEKDERERRLSENNNRRNA